MEWREDGILLSVRRHGESAAIAEVFTRDHGRHMGVVRGGASRRMSPILQVGAQLDLTWRARLDAHLGVFTVELIRSRAAAVMDDPLALSALSSALGLASFALSEREAVPKLYDDTHALLEALVAGQGWLPLYLEWEMDLLTGMGFGLDLSQCAVTGSTQDLAYVSPRSGRAVSRGAAGEWADRLLTLPAFLRGVGIADLSAMREGFALTGYFLTHRLAPALGDKPLPAARERFMARLAKAAS